MRRTARTTVGLLTAATMALTTVGTAQAVPVRAAPEQVPEIALAELIAEVNEAERSLGSLGLSFADFADLEDRGPEFLAELEALLDGLDGEPEPEPDPEPEPEPGPGPGGMLVGPPMLGEGVVWGSGLPVGPLVEPVPSATAPVTAADSTRKDLQAEWLAHAYDMAELNSRRDRNARDIGSETVFMYLSHYVDLPQDPALYPVDYNSHANRYASWLTDEDRLVFERFLQVGPNAQLGRDLSQAGFAMASVAKSPASIREVFEGSKRVVERLALAAEEGWDLLQVFNDREVLQRLKDAWNEGDSPTVIVDRIASGLTVGDDSKEVRDAVVGVLLAAAGAAVGGPGGVAVAIALAGVSIATLAMKDVINQAAVAGLLLTATSRVTLRYLRSIGMD